MAILITSDQVRAARALLKWGQAELAEKSCVSIPAIANIETDRQQPSLSTQMRLVKALADAGVELIDGGVRRTRNAIQVFEGDHAHTALLDDIYQELCRTGGQEVLIVGLREMTAYERGRRKLDTDYLKAHLRRLEVLGVRERILTTAQSQDLLLPRSCYRVLPDEYFSPYAFHIYGDSIAMGAEGPPAQVIIIKSSYFSQSLRGLFNFTWNHAAPLI